MEAMDKADWREVARLVQPELTDEEFDDMWQAWIVARTYH